MASRGEARIRPRLLFAVSLLALALYIGLQADDTLAGFAVTHLPDANSAIIPGQSTSPVSGKQTPFDCSQIKALSIDKQTNMRAARIMRDCSGQSSKGETRSLVPVTPFKNVFSPFLLGTDDVDVVTGPEDWPHVTQSESVIWSKGRDNIVINYNDSADSPAGNYSGVSYSDDGGARFTRIFPSPFNSGHGSNLGSPILVHNDRLGLWFAGDLVSGCGGFGIGLWTSVDGALWTVGACAHTNMNDDHPSMWADNNPSSPYYGRMYISYNSFTLINSLQVIYSDDGDNWSGGVVLTTAFRRNMQLTGGPDGSIFVAAMDENGGGLNSRTHFMYRSTDGGGNWTWSTMAANTSSPGSERCSSNTYFSIITPNWRYMGWGQPDAGPRGVIHYAYGAHGDLGDEGDVFYVRSTDNGATWSSPLRLNSDSTLREQWMPSLSVSPQGAVTVAWYDRRNTTDGYNYEYRAVVSLDNGVTWGTDDAVSDGLILQPEQPDPNLSDCFAGDYNYHYATDNLAFLTWTDGRVLSGGRSQQDVFFDRIEHATVTPTPTVTGTPPTATPTPPCGTNPHYVISALQGVPTVTATNLVAGSRCDECTTTITLPFSHTLYCNAFGTATLGSNGIIGFVANDNPYSNVCLPHGTFDHVIAAHWDDLDMSSSAGLGLGIYTSVTGVAPHRTFNIEWRACRYNGGNCGGSVDFTVLLHESQTKFEVIYGAVSNNGHSATVGVQGGRGDPVTQRGCNPVELEPGLELTYRLSYALLGTTVTPTPIPSNTPTGTPPTPTATPVCASEPRYDFSPSDGVPIEPGTNRVPNSLCRGCILRCELPFDYVLYGQTYTGVNISSNGVLQFGTPAPDDRHACSLTTAFNYAIFAHWDDLDMREEVSSTLGIYTSVTGFAPSRIFNIEWRACRYAAGACGGAENFEVRLYEGQQKFDIIYGEVEGGGTNASIGSSGGTSSQNTSFSCDQNILRPGLQLAFQQMCFVPSPTPTNTSTPTPVLVGHVTWQGRPGQPTPSQQIPVTLTLRLASGGPDLEYTSMTTNASGFFTVPVTGLTGLYNWRLKSAQPSPTPANNNPGWLATSGSVTLGGGSVTNQEMGLQRSGDCDNNNVVNTSDFNILKNTFGKSIGQTGYDNRADITGDTVVNSSDFNSLKANFGFGGAPPIRP